MNSNVTGSWTDLNFDVEHEGEKTFYVYRTYDRFQRVHFCRFEIVSCEVCSKSFKRKTSTKGKSTRFCSKDCFVISSRVGSVKENRERHFLDTIGVKTPSMLSQCTEKMIKTRIENTGAACPADPNSSSHDQFKATMNERHGGDFAQQAPGPKAKRKKTVIDRYGCDPLALCENRDPEMLKTAGQKGYRSLVKRMGDDALSKPEASLSRWLKQRYGEDDVVQQYELDHGGRRAWLIDFYVKSIDMYIEMDGVFWHGLDKPLDELKIVAPTIYNTYLRDRVQDDWFVKAGKKLLRVTDIQWHSYCKSNDFSSIEQALGG